MYRPGQPIWEFTMWKFQDLSNTQILCKMKFGHFEAPKNCHSDYLSSSDFEFLEFLTFAGVKFFQKSKFKPSKIDKTAVFDLQKSAKIGFT